MLKRANWPILMLTLALAGCGGGGGGGGTPAPTANTGSSSNVITIAPGAGPAGSTSTSGSTSSGSTTATGQPLSVSGLSGYPQGIAVSGSTLYVANTNGQSISAITLTPPNYPMVSIRLTYPTGAPQLTQPTGLAVSQDGKLYVANWSGPVDSQGNPGPGFIDVVDIATGNVTLLATGLNNPDGLALSADGNSLFIANHGHGDVRQISTINNGTTLATYTYPASSAAYPWGVYADGSDVYATNSNGTVSKWTIVSSGATPSMPTTVATFASPSGITGANGYLYVADYQAETINKIDLTSTPPTVVATVGVNPRQPFFLAHDNTYLYFTDGNNGSVNAIPLP